MQVLKLPKWCYSQLDRIRRAFLWKGKKSCVGGQCLVNWDSCCLPKKNGGLGILNMHVQNDALLMKWLWKLQKEPNSVWSESIRTIYGTTEISDLSNVQCLSYELKDILQIRGFYSCSCTFQGDESAIQWRWTSDGLFSSKSAYSRMIDPGVTTPFLKRLWKIKTTPKVKTFLWLVLLNRILTQENLEKRGWPSIQNCVLCNLPEKETTSHLFLHCPFAVSVWLLATGGTTRPENEEDLKGFWIRRKRNCNTWKDTGIAAVIWNLWKARNGIIFEAKNVNIWQVAGRAIQDCALWEAFG
ncbi:Ribonuclease H-like superfamily protein [Rhynchospora pubera]|uniref:Ribonuclease H-like superfamily protein n=1 Tax=Rhynchospora pubera TaxID=906938 RepID=A0AAV8DGZ7_9POAL|nr:Ribonuclease H-like superfamily protein [Rhynchospora pubera]